MESANQAIGGRVAVIAGGVGGIGRAVVRLLARAGAVVHSVDVHDDDSSTGHRVDIRSAEECRNVIGRIADRDGPVGVLVNSAAVLGEVGPVESLDLARWQDTFAVNVEGTLNMIAAVLPGMYEQGFGRIINIASMAGEYGAPNKAAYVATKHAILGLTRTVALEAGTRGVTCNAVSPSWVDVGLGRRQFVDIARKSGEVTSEEISGRIAQSSAVGRLVEVDEVASIVVDILKHPSITGTRIAIDGGVGAGSFNIMRPTDSDEQ